MIRPVLAAMVALCAAAPAFAQTSAAADTQDTPAKAPGPEPTPAPAAPAADEPPPPSALTADTRRPPTPGLIGDWLRIRTRLAQRGITVTARYASESATNLSGGDETLFRETGQFDGGVLLDLDKVAGIKGGAVQATLTYRRGFNLSDDANLGTLQQVQEVFGRGQTVRVTQLWYEQTIGQKLEIKLGLTNPGEDFAGFSCQFMNLSFCGSQPGNLAGDYWYNWPVSQPGFRVRYKLDDTHSLSAAIYQVNPRAAASRDFYVVRFGGATGALIPVEYAWTPSFGGRPGSYKLGGWLSTVHGDDLLLDVDRQPLTVTGADPLRRSSRWGVYVNVEQQLTGRARDGKPVSGLSVFANMTQTDRLTTLTDNQIAVGLFYRGLLPWMRGEFLGLAFARTAINGRATRAQRLDPAGPPVQRDGEYAAELFYSIQPLEGLELRPNLQFIHRPGGRSDLPDATILGLKAAVTL